MAQNAELKKVLALYLNFTTKIDFVDLKFYFVPTFIPANFLQAFERKRKRSFVKVDRVPFSDEKRRH